MDYAKRKWMENEIRLAVIEDSKMYYGDANKEKREKIINNYRKVGEFYEKLMNENNETSSIIISCINKLKQSKLLSPITDSAEDWDDYGYKGTDVLGDYTYYQSSRLFSLFKYVYKNGNVEYVDNSRCIAVNADNPDSEIYLKAFVSRIMCEVLPIKIPYLPEEPIKVRVRLHLFNHDKAPYDTIHIIDAIQPNGSILSINRYFKDSKGVLEEIDLKEYKIRTI